MAKQDYLLSDEILHYAYYSIISNYYSVYILFCKRCNYKLHYLLKMSDGWNIIPESVKKKKLSSGRLYSREMECCWLVCQLLRWYRITWFCYYA